MVDVSDLLAAGVYHPKDFLNVVGHVLKSLFAFSQRDLRISPFGHIAEDQDVASGQVVCGRRKVDEQR